MRIKGSSLWAVLALFVSSSTWAVEVLEQVSPPSIRNTASTQQNGGEGVQISASNAGKQSFHLVVDSAGKTSIQKLTAGVKFDAVGTKTARPSSGTTVYTTASYSCSSSDAITKINCSSGTVPSGPYDSTGLTIDTTGLTGGYLVKQQSSSTCADLDSTNTSGYTRYNFSSTYTCSGGGSGPCKGQTLCSHLAYWDGSDNLVLAQAEAGKLTYGTTSNCFIISLPHECDGGPPPP
jgi:hypothetical protein